MVKKLLGDAVREERLRRNLSQNSLILYMVFIFVQNTTSIFLLRIQSSLSDTPGSQTEPLHTALTPLSPFHYRTPSRDNRYIDSAVLPLPIQFPAHFL